MKKERRKAKKEVTTFAGVSLRRFGVTYVILMGLFFFLISFTPFLKVIDLNGLYSKGVVAATAALLGTIGVACTPHGSILQLPSIALDVRFGCNGLEAVMIYSVAVIAFPASWKRKIMGIIAGFLVIQVMNILRITALAYAGIHFNNIFEYIHIYVAQGIMIAISLGVFFVYLNYAGTRKEASA